MAAKRSALAREGEIVRRNVHGDAHVERRYREADDFLKMFEHVTDELCRGLREPERVRHRARSDPGIRGRTTRGA